jgi:hypothetical protein
VEALRLPHVVHHLSRKHDHYSFKAVQVYNSEDKTSIYHKFFPSDSTRLDVQALAALVMDNKGTMVGRGNQVDDTKLSYHLDSGYNPQYAPGKAKTAYGQKWNTVGKGTYNLGVHAVAVFSILLNMGRSIRHEFPDSFPDESRRKLPLVAEYVAKIPDKDPATQSQRVFNEFRETELPDGTAEAILEFFFEAFTIVVTAANHTFGEHTDSRKLLEDGIRKRRYMVMSFPRQER